MVKYLILKMRCLIPVAVVSLLLLLIVSIAFTAELKVGQKAEWYPPKTILMHTPGDEVFLGVLHPQAALFEKPFDLNLARSQHLQYIERLKKRGVKVYRMVDVLLEGTIDEKGNLINSPQLDNLRVFAEKSLRFDCSGLAEEEGTVQEKYKHSVVSRLSPHELVRIILQRPTIHLSRNDINTGMSATYEMEPVMNLYFLRDQMITTAKGVVISRMNSVQRAPETEIVKFALKKMGIEPVYEVTGDGRLEGGDFLPAGDVAFIGQGLRTNADGVKQLLDHQVFGTPYVAVVKDNWNNQEQMHLDTYFNIIGPNLAVLIDFRMKIPGISPEIEGVSSLVDVYKLEENGYRRIIRDRDFQQYLEKDLGYTIIPVSRKDQNCYGINFLTVAPKEILAIDGVSQVYKDALKKEGVKVEWMDFGELTKGYGAAHCTTQALRRISP